VNLSTFFSSPLLFFSLLQEFALPFFLLPPPPLSTLNFQGSKMRLGLLHPLLPLLTLPPHPFFFPFFPQGRQATEREDLKNREKPKGQSLLSSSFDCSIRVKGGEGRKFSSLPPPPLSFLSFPLLIFFFSSPPFFPPP